MAKNILVLHSSADKQHSYSRLLANEFIELLQQQAGDYTFVVRDLAHEPIPVLNDDTIRLIRTPRAQLSETEQQVLAVSDELIAELKAADFVVIGSPMYNWSIPAALKAWLDQVMRIGETFGHSEAGLQGYLDNKPGLVIMTRGGIYSDPARAVVDMQRPYLTNVMKVMGLDATMLTLEGTLAGEEGLQASLAAARTELLTAAESLR